jgi:hypothetical protein
LRRESAWQRRGRPSTCAKLNEEERLRAKGKRRVGKLEAKVGELEARLKALEKEGRNRWAHVPGPRHLPPLLRGSRTRLWLGASCGHEAPLRGGEASRKRAPNCRPPFGDPPWGRLQACQLGSGGLPRGGDWFADPFSMT